MSVSFLYVKKLLSNLKNFLLLADDLSTNLVEIQLLYLQIVLLFINSIGF